ATVVNKGRLSTSKTVSAALLINGNSVAGTTVPVLDRDQTAEIRFSYSLAQLKGMKEFKVVVDALNILKESFEDNNAMAKYLLISPRIPGKPSIIKVEPYGASILGIRWAQDADPRLKTYKLYMAESANGNSLVNKRLVKESSAKDPHVAAVGELQSSREYYFQLEVVNDIGNSALSDVKYGKTNDAGTITITKPKEGDESDTGIVEVWAQVDDAENRIEYVDFSSGDTIPQGAVRDNAPENGVWKATLNFSIHPHKVVEIKAFGRGENMQQVVDSVSILVEAPAEHKFYSQDKRNVRGTDKLCAYSQYIKPAYLKSVDLYLDGQLKASLTPQEGWEWWELTEWCQEIDTTKIADGEHKLEAKMMTPGGSQVLYSTTAVFETKNGLAPAVVITSPLGGSDLSGLIKLKAKVTKDDGRTNCVKFYFSRGWNREFLGETQAKEGDEWVYEWESRNLVNRFTASGWLEVDALSAIIPNTPCSEGSELVATYHQPIAVDIDNTGELYLVEVLKPKEGDVLYRKAEIRVKKQYNFLTGVTEVTPSLMHEDGTIACGWMGRITVGEDDIGNMSFDTTVCQFADIENGEYYLEFDAPIVFKSGVFTIDNDHPPQEAPPDLIFEGGIKIDKPIVIAGQPVKFSSLLKNIGQGPVTERGNLGKYKIYMGIFANGKVMYGGRFEAFGEFNDKRFDAGEEQEVSFTWVPKDVGNYKIELAVDTYINGHSFNYWQETNENNNLITRELRVYHPDDVIGGLLTPLDLLAQMGMVASVWSGGMAIAEAVQEEKEKEGETPDVPDKEPEEEEQAPVQVQHELIVERLKVTIGERKGEARYYIDSSIRSTRSRIDDPFKIAIGLKGGSKLYEETVDGLSGRRVIDPFVAIPAGTSTTAEVCLTVDSENVVNETNEDNNVYCIEPVLPSTGTTGTTDDEEEEEEPEGNYCCEYYSDITAICTYVDSESACYALGGIPIGTHPPFDCEEGHCA
ncbi:MAG: hypothetical protein JXB14_07900, partial [Candidatus Altiarchaeota archaeon]|nr:hypothetical protein [Candidatus Altiarchaeota archaeon]